MIRILIADDHAVVRQGLKKILSEHSDMSVVGEAGDARQLCDLLEERQYDVLILDMSMPGKSGLDTLKDIRRERPRLPILVLTMLPEDQFGRRVLKAGAAGYMTKGTAPEELVRAIRKIFAGGKFISPGLAELLAADLDHHHENLPHEALSDREFQVFLKLASGDSVTNIAADLSLSAKTVTTYRARVLEKMRMKSNAELARYVAEHRLGSEETG